MHIMSKQLKKVLSMGISSNTLSIDGFALCISCRKKTFIDRLEVCVVCDRFVCADCAKYRRQGNPYGWICKKCALKIAGN